MPSSGRRLAPSSRFGSSFTSISLRLRLLLTVPVVIPFPVLVHSLVAWAREDDPRIAALVLFILGVYLVYAVPFLRAVWRSNPVWLGDQAKASAVERRLRSGLANTPAEDGPVGVPSHFDERPPSRW